MRILYVCRLFSGLAEGIREGRWDPRGVPTVYRLLEALDKSDHDLRLVFTVKDDAVGWPESKTLTFPIEGFGRKITVIPQRAALPASLGRARGYLREIVQYREIRRICAEFAPNVAYFDRVNIYPAALTAHRTNVRVIWRVMGVPAAMHEMLEHRGAIARLTRWAYRAPFASVICSRDGSGGAQWMERALVPHTPRHMMINGVDPAGTSPLAPDLKSQLGGSETKILFVARLVEDKGCIEFIEATSMALKAAPGRFQAVIAGSGPLAEQMRERARQNGCDDRFHFLGQVPHNQILSLQRACDIYVSLNRMCNLTNANLEAMKTGMCMIIPASPGTRGIDVDTDELMPSDTIWRIADSGDVQGLSDALIYLDTNPAERDRRAKQIAARANTFIPTWDARISNEIEMLEQLAAGHE